ncbi:phosphoribosylformimino-5-aminoimidazole carboxamide ribotide isomerase [Methanomicrobium sp. W14]|uniref:HisA/HisF-related TIM barrel protein n=1 Tax=Methanomicrobium sp. W14 TaxID=2817839 RepID=UPI001AE25A47|nr:HisA/HisF-related TIM barrel protein [Methanomicrobium sp. W14]MBP2134596.1 phosphoribosylformimino-5-aminoimidazole carboxamide ribotide isomerase [Methanomicrobium sp. W14]
MKIFLAVDILNGNVVHGYKGRRSEYRPLDWGIAKSTVPCKYIQEMGAKNVYFADLNMIEGTGNNNSEILACRGLTGTAIINRGAKKPEDAIKENWLKSVISSETCTEEQKNFPTGSFDYFSIVVRDKKTYPSKKLPAEVFSACNEWNFNGGIVMNLSSVGSEDRMGGLDIESIRKSYSKELLYGGGVYDMEDLKRLYDAGYDGAIITTAVHKGRIPKEILAEGEICW